MNVTRHHIVTAIVALIGVTGVGLVLHAWNLPPFRTTIETTEDAYVRGMVTTVSPQLAAYVASVEVTDFQHVDEGQLLVRLDDGSFAQQVNKARATLDSAEAALAASAQSEAAARAQIRSAEAAITAARTTLETARINDTRTRELQDRGAGTQSAVDTSRTTLSQAEAALNQGEAALEVARQNLNVIVTDRRSLEAAIESAKAGLALAEIDLGNTRITAPQAGIVGEIRVRKGQYVTAGTQLASLVPATRWIIANFKETQIPGMKIGQPLSFRIDAVPGQVFTCTIERFSPATGSEFSVIRTDNATGNFTKVAQRVPVRIAIDPDQAGFDQLIPGMSAVVRINTESTSASHS